MSAKVSRLLEAICLDTYVMHDVQRLHLFTRLCLTIDVQEGPDCSGPDSNVDVKFGGKGNYLSIVAVCATSSHDIQAQGKGGVDVGFAWGSRIKAVPHSPSVLSLGVPAYAPSRICYDKSLEVVGVLPHVFYGVFTKLGMLTLFAIHLVGEGVK